MYGIKIKFNFRYTLLILFIYIYIYFIDYLKKACTHGFCEKCILKWTVNSDTCPVCRCYAGKNDGFILADQKPDYYNLQVFIFEFFLIKTKLNVIFKGRAI